MSSLTGRSVRLTPQRPRTGHRVVPNRKHPKHAARPTVERALNALLANIKTQITSPNPKGPALPALANPLVANMVGLRIVCFNIYCCFVGFYCISF